MGYIVGIDGGGTKTILEVVDKDGNLLVKCTGGPSNINSFGEENVKYVLYNLILSAINKLNIQIKDCESICIGAAGADRIEEKKVMENIIKSIGFAGKIIVVNDAEIALYGGLGKGEGLIVISGTGSICYGRNEFGETYRAGGWGHIIGDEGSGYDIGIKALKSVMRSFDGRGEKTILTPLILDSLNLSSPKDLVQYVYRSRIGKKEISKIAELVYEALKNKDKVSERIINDAAYELFICVRAVIEKLGFNNKHTLLTTGGSNINRNEFLLHSFSNLIQLNYPCIEIVPMKNDSAWGACLIAKKLIDDVE